MVTVRYVHIMTGVINTRAGWESSYDPEELELRGLTAAEAFAEDLYVTLVPI